ncbi:hypothetical protein LXL04_005263 [Taraxacum kok-saghyz]
MSIGSTSQAGSRGRRRKVVTCDCGDVCSLAVARTKDNYGKKFYGCPNYQVEGGDCGFFKWYEEEEDGKVYNSQCLKLKKISEQDQMKTLLEVIVGLLVIIVVMLIVVVDITKYNVVEWFKGKIDINIDNGIHYIYHNVKLYENNWINGAHSGCKS